MILKTKKGSTLFFFFFYNKPKENFREAVVLNRPEATILATTV